jgi:hypothetical protein
MKEFDEFALKDTLLALLFLMKGDGKSAPTTIPVEFLKMLEEEKLGKVSKDGLTFKFSKDGLENGALLYEEILTEYDYDAILDDFDDDFEFDSGTVEQILKSMSQNMFAEPKRPEPVREENTTKVFTLKISLKHMKPPVWRRVQVPGYLTLEDLKEIIFLLFDWTGMHLFSFYINNHEYPEPDFDLIGGFEEPFESKEELSKYQLSGIIGKLKKFSFTYDFGDDWEHDIVVEKVEDNPTIRVPEVLKVQGAVPVEDSGGPHGVELAQKILKNPKHPEYASYIEMFGDNQITKEPASIEEYNAFLSKLFNQSKLRIVKK